MRYLFLYLFLVLSISYGFNSKNETETELVKKHFNEKERKELTQIISFVDSVVLANNKYLDINPAYHYYLDSIYKLIETGKMVDIAFDEESKYHFLFNLDSILFKKIWVKSTTSKMVKTKDTILYNPENYTRIELNTVSSYMNLIKELGVNNPNYNDIYKSCVIAGGLSPSLLTTFLNQNRKYNFELFHNHLWAAIFLLTLEENIDKKVDRYLKNRNSAHKSKLPAVGFPRKTGQAALRRTVNLSNSAE